MNPEIDEQVWGVPAEGHWPSGGSPLSSQREWAREKAALLKEIEELKQGFAECRKAYSRLRDGGSS